MAKSFLLFHQDKKLAKDYAEENNCSKNADNDKRGEKVSSIILLFLGTVNLSKKW